MRDSLRIRQSAYRGVEGYTLSGRRPEWVWPVKIFSPHRERLERIRELLRGPLKGPELWAATGAALKGIPE